MALTTLAEVKTYLGIAGTALDARLDALRGAAEATVEKWCRRSFLSASYTEFLDGAGARFLPLRRRPVSAVASVALAPRGSYGASAGDYTALAEGVDYALQLRDSAQGATGVLVKLNGVWPTHPGYGRGGILSWEQESGLGNVKIVYAAGYAAVPDDVKFAVAEVTAYMLRTSKRGGADYSERLGDHSYMIPMARIRTAPELGTVRSVLGQYRETSW